MIAVTDNIVKCFFIILPLIALIMILYNVTINVEDSVHNNWFEWMKNVHLPEVMSTGKFVEYRMFRIITRQDGETGQTYSIQYFSNNLEDYLSYKEHDAPALQKKTLDLFGEKVFAFRTILEEV